jgi:phosphopentomutase
MLHVLHESGPRHRAAFRGRDGRDNYVRTGNRRDYAIMTPPGETLCDWVRGGRACKVHAIGKIGDIFSMQGISTTW